MIDEETIPNPIPIGRILIVDAKSSHLSREAIGINRLVVTEGAKVMRAHPFVPGELAPRPVHHTEPSVKRAPRMPRFRGHWMGPIPMPPEPGSSDVFPDDPRQNFRPDTYPFWTIGRVESFGESNKVATAALVGPRHILMRRQDLPWMQDGSLGMLKFSPGLYADASGVSTTAPESWATEVFYKTRSDTPFDDFDIAEDIAVCVLLDRLGDQIGWLGSRSYHTEWDTKPYWIQVGYPAAIGGGLQPSGQVGVSVAIDLPSLRHPIDGRVLVSDAVTSSGDGGGPLFGFWDEGPAIIGISSRLSPAPIPIPTLAGGGVEMVELVRKAIEQRP